MKINVEKRDALWKATRNWSEGAVTLEEDHEGAHWYVRANGGVMNASDAQQFAIKVDVLSFIVAAMNGAEVEIDWSQKCNDRDQFIEDYQKFTGLLEDAASGRSWETTGRDVVEILQK